MRNLFSSLGTAVRWHRRGLAALAAAVAVLATISALRPASPPTVEVVVAAGVIPAGTKLTPDHLRLVALPVKAVPDGALTDLSAALGATAIAPLPRGQVLTPQSLVEAGRALPKGQVLVPLRLGDTSVATLLRVGDQVSVVSTDAQGRPVVLAPRVRVAALPQPAQGGPLAGGDDGRGLVLVQTDTETGARLVSAAAVGQVGLMWV
ncbi:SAF domain-containing protein [Aestuariimicrobium ganziense]|uniref:SAF domain-containing protein n=1 Tax=Aestuariimicrobium ganziense TaxID=2773677 RepID=UPI001945589F|nr:SAF domain-containing protein [Aestuariimicrobium ganziense]